MGDCQAIALFVAIFLTTTLTAQSTQLTGRVTTNGEAVPLASLLLTDTNDGDIVAFAYADAEGRYQMKADTSGRFLLVASAMGYAADTVVVTLDDTALRQDFNLKAVAFAFRSITVKARRVIEEKKDTVIIDAQTFAEGNEDVVEDLLRKIPGLTVGSDGGISVDGQEVDRVLIEGDDMFEQGYRMLTKNLPAYPIKNVEILRNYSRNRLLKDIEDRQRVAINLTLQEQYRRVWNGNARLGYGPAPAERYYGQANLMNFGKRNKYYFLASANNVGSNTTGSIDYLLRPQRQGEPDEIGTDVSIPTLVPFGEPAPNFSPDRTLLNNDELLSANAVLSPAKRLKVKLMAFGNADENYLRERGILELLPENAEPLTLRDSSYVRRAPLAFGGRVEATYQLADDADLRYTGRYAYEEETGFQESVFNGLPRNLDLKRKGGDNDHHLNLTHRLNDQSVLSTSLAHLNRNLGTRVRAQNSFLFGSEASDFTQDLNVELKYRGVSSHYLRHTARGHTLGSRLSFAHRRDALPVLSPGLTESNRPFDYELRELLGDVLYKHKIGRFRLVGQFVGGRRRVSLLDLDEDVRIRPWVLNPTVGFEYREGQKHRFNLALGHAQNPATADQSLSTPLAHDFRRIQVGTAVPLQLESTSLGLRYQRGSWSDRFFFTLIASAARDHDYLTSRRFVGPETELNEWYRATDRNRLQAKLEMNYFLKKWRVNLRCELDGNYAELEDELNGTRRDLQQRRLRQQWSFRTASVGKLNVGAGYGRTQQSVRTDQLRFAGEQHWFANLNYQLAKRFLFSANADHYVFTAAGGRSRQTFVDAELRYTPRDQRFGYSLRARNLLGGGSYRNLAVTDFSRTERSYAIQPAYVMARVEWRFK